MFFTDKATLETFSADKRLWQGTPSIEVTKGCRMFLTYYSGSIKEGMGNDRFCK